MILLNCTQIQQELVILINHGHKTLTDNNKKINKYRYTITNINICIKFNFIFNLI